MIRRSARGSWTAASACSAVDDAWNDVCFLMAGAVRRVGRCDSYATEFDLEAEEYVPMPKGDVHKKKEIVQASARLCSL